LGHRFDVSFGAGGWDDVLDYGVAVLDEVVAPVVVFLSDVGEGYVRHDGGLGFKEGEKDAVKEGWREQLKVGVQRF
jgi:hypothetical protein